MLRARTRLVELPQFAFTIAGHCKKLLREFDGFRFGIRLQQSEAADNFLRLDERPVRYDHLGKRCISETSCTFEGLSHLGHGVKQRPEAYQHLERARSNLLVSERISLERLDGRGSN